MHLRFRRPARLQVLLWSAVLAALPALAGPVQAADLDKVDSSLKLIPADATFYSSMLRNREQIEAITKSRAWAKLWAHPLVQAGWTKVKQEYENPNGQAATFRQFMQLPENQQLVDMLLDMGSHEIFLYGGKSWEDFADLFVQAIGAARYGPLLQMLQDFKPGADQQAAQAKALLHALNNNLDLIKTPDLVLGFKLTDAERADFQMKRLELVLNALIQQAPPLKGRLKRQNLAGGKFLTLELDGSLVPWNEIPFADFENKPGEFDKLKEKLQSLKLVIAIGVRDNYLLMAFGPTTEPITRLGQGKRLLERPEFQKLAPHADKRLTSIDYVSQALQARVATTPEDLEGMLDLANEAAQNAPLTDAQKARLKKDLAALAKDLAPYLPRPGASLSYSFMNGRGIETLSYDWSTGSELDGSKPLTLLNHVGGTPILAAIGRTKYKPENYDLAVKWLKVAYGYFEEIGLPRMPEEQRKQFEEFTKGMFPLLRKMDDVNRKMLLPALADSQSGLVLDAKITSPQWVLLQPPANKPLPMLELAFVFGVSDAKLLEQACAEYRSLLNAMIVQAQRVQPMQVPAFQIPAPTTQDLKVGTMYYYPLPPNLPLDRQLLPNAGLAKEVAVLTLSESHTQRLLSKKPLQVDGGPLADLAKPRAGAVYFDWAGLVDALQPWVEYAIQFVPANADNQKEVEQATSLVFTGLEVLKVLRTVTTSTTFEDGVQVTHTEAVLRDIPAGR